MNRLFYPKLALTNIKKNGRTYFPYMLTSICTIMMFYILHSISINDGLNRMSGSESLKAVLMFGTIVIGIFSAIFLFYTNSFLLKRRKKELGLYNILGLGKKHIAIVLFFESIVISSVSIVAGSVGGVIASKLMFLLLLKLLAFSVPFGFSIPLQSLLLTLAVFTGIFLVIMVSNLFHIRIANPVELLKGGQYGEREPKTKWILAIVGVIALGAGYYIALTVESPLSALNIFFIAVILVMTGTYALFTAGSIALLKLLRKNKEFYYRTRNFTAVSGMIYRMKQNAVGLANICILSTAVLIMFSTTVSLYVGMENALENRFPNDVQMSSRISTQEQALTINTIIESEAKANNAMIHGKIDHWWDGYICTKVNNRFILGSAAMNNPAFSMLVVVSLSDYNRLEGKNAVLDDDELLLFTPSKDYGSDTLVFQDMAFMVKETLDTTVLGSQNGMDIVKTYLIVVKDREVLGKIASGVPEYKPASPSYRLVFDMDGSNKEIMAFTDRLQQRFRESSLEVHVESAAGSRQSLFAVYGGLFFLGIFLGTLFLMATVLIIYYKQISEGYDDKARFEIMQKVGMSKLEIKQTIRRQILMVFFIPLVFTVIHTAFAFPIVTKLLAVLNFTNVTLYVWATVLTILVFAAIYGLVYSWTARVYYRIVE